MRNSPSASGAGALGAPWALASHFCTGVGTGVEAGGAGRMGPAPWWGGAISLGSDVTLKLDHGGSQGVKGGLEAGLKLGMGLKLGAGARGSGSP